MIRKLKSTSNLKKNKAEWGISIASKMLFFSLFFIAILAVVSYSENIQDQADYPAWFWNPPDNDGYMYAVGLFQPCLLNDSTLLYAKSDAVWNIISQNRINIRLESAMSGPESNLMYMGSTINIEVDSLQYDNVSENNVILDSFYRGNMLIVLVGQGDDSSGFTGSLIAQDFGDWIHELPADERYFYSAGMAPDYYYQSNSWKEALNKALLDMTAQISSKVRSFQTSDRYSIFQTIVEESEATLTDWQVVARKYDTANNSCNVLIRMPKFK